MATVLIEEAMAVALRHQQAGQLADAERIYRQVLAGNPNHPGALHLLGLIAHQVGRNDVAISMIERALLFAGGDGIFHRNLGEICRTSGQLEKALTHASRAAALLPSDPQSHINLGFVHDSAGRFVDAERCYRRAVELAPDLAGAHLRLLTSIEQQGRLADVITASESAVRLNLTNVQLLVAAGNAWMAKNDPADALAYFRRAIDVQPDCPEAHLNAALCLLKLGQYIEGWREYEWRWQCPGWHSHHKTMPQPLWNGEDIRGKTILLHAEQGYGDTFMLARYLPMLAGRGPRIIIGCRPELKALIERWPGVIDTLVVGGNVPAFDVQVMMASLPRIFGTTLETMPGPVGYIRADETRAARWRSKLAEVAGTARLKVGLVWAGQALPDPRRSCGLAALAPLADVKDALFVSLQKGSEADEARHPPAGLRLYNPADELVDFAETAALVDALDLVITIDSAAAHLAGAIGKPTWTLLPLNGSYQWLVDRDDSPWYPTMRLFRQSAPGDWKSVIANAAQALKERPRTAWSLRSGLM